MKNTIGDFFTLSLRKKEQGKKEQGKSRIDAAQALRKKVMADELAEFGYDPEGNIIDKSKVKHFDGKKDYSHKETVGLFQEKPVKVYNIDELEEIDDAYAFSEFFNKKIDESKKNDGEEETEETNSGEEESFEDQDILKIWISDVQKLKANEARKYREQQRLKAIEERPYYEEKAKKPYYSNEELALQEECLQYLAKDGWHKKPKPRYENSDLDYAGIKEMAREGAIHRIMEGTMPKDYFRVETYNNKRQLFKIQVVENGKDKDQEGKTKAEKIIIKYIYESNDLPAGNYAYEAAPDKIINNGNFILVPLRLVVALDIKEAEQKKTA